MRAQAVRALAIMCCLGTGASALAQAAGEPATPEPTFTLTEATRALLDEHPSLDAQQAEVSAARSDLVAAPLWANPNLGMSYTKSPRGGTWDKAGYITGALEQFVEVRGVPRARARVARRELEATRGDYLALRNDLVLDLEETAVELEGMQQIVTVYEEVVVLLSEGRELVHEAVANGSDPDYDAARVDVALVDAHADALQSRAELALALSRLRMAVGPGAYRLPKRIVLDLYAAPPLPELSQLVSEFSQQRGDVKAARARAAAASLSVDVTRRSVWPGMSVSALGAFGQNPGEVDLGLQVYVPLPTVNRGQGRIAAAEQRASAERSSLKALELATLLPIEQLRERVTYMRQNVAAYRERGVAAGKHLLAEAQIAYLKDGFSALELTDAYAVWRDNHLRAIELAIQACKAEIELGRLIGRSLRNPLPSSSQAR